MNFRQRMHSADSPAEYQILNELIHRGLGKHLESSVANGGHGFTFIYQIDGCLGTVPDYYWGHGIRLAVYLDGPIHIRREVKDILIDEALRRRKVNVLRISYKPPLSKRRCREVVDKIERALTEVSTNGKNC